MSWSFIISTDGSNLFFISSIIESIRKQNIPNYEILFTIEKDSLFFIHEKDVKVIYVDTYKPKQITLKKNEASKHAIYDNLCFIHDYIKLSDNWYDGFQSFGYDWNVCTTKIINDNGNRLWDWCVYKHPELGHTNVDYEMEATPYHYAPGNNFCCKRLFFLENPLNQELCWDDGEDIEWSKRIHKKWNYKLNKLSSVHCMKHK
jgi:hypothetical protein